MKRLLLVGLFFVAGCDLQPWTYDITTPTGVVTLYGCEAIADRAGTLHIRPCNSGGRYTAMARGEWTRVDTRTGSSQP